MGYEVAWAKGFAVGLGSEMPAIWAVISALFGGMVLGAWLLDRPISRSARPGLWYAGLGVEIGLWGIASEWLIPVANRWALEGIGLRSAWAGHWTIAFLIPFGVLLPATAGIGATLVAMERLVAPDCKDGRCVGGLYAANTLGAVAGVLGSAFVLIPAWGLNATFWCLGGVNLACGAGAFAAGMTRASKGADGKGPVEAAIARGGLPLARLYGTLGLTGFLGVAYEALGIRVLSQVLENTVYTFALILAVYLAGMALGGALYQRWGGKRSPRLELTDLLCGLGASGLFGIWVLGRVPGIYGFIRGAMGRGDGGSLLAEGLAAALVFGLPAIWMGATFSQLAQSARRPDGGVGRALAVNTLGAAAAPIVVGLALLPHMGSRWGLAVISLAYLAAVPDLRRGRWARVAVAAAPILLLPGDLNFLKLDGGSRVMAYQEGTMANVAVLKGPDGGRTLVVDQHFQMGGTMAAVAERRQAAIPLLLHPHPRRALFLGVGTGISFGAAEAEPGLKADGVELVPEVARLMHYFEPENGAPDHYPGFRLYVADARRFVRVSPTRYDVVVGDLFQPARDGAGALYTREQFAAVRRCLASGGVFCQWLPLYQMDVRTLRLVIRTFLSVFPRARAYLLRFNVDAPVLGLVGRLGDSPYDARWVERRLGYRPLKEQLRKLALADSVRLFGCLVAGPEGLAGFAGRGPLNEDAHPLLTYWAPDYVYWGGQAPFGTLLRLLAQTHADTEDLFGGAALGSDGSFARRVNDFIAARNVYLRGLVDETEGHMQAAIEAYVQSARRSADFTTGYARCLTMIPLLEREGPAEARRLLERLAAAQPSRPVAAELLQRLPR